MATDANTILASVSPFLAKDPRSLQLLELAYLKQILLDINPYAVTNPNILLADNACLTCLSAKQLSVIELALFQQLVDLGGITSGLDVTVQNLKLSQPQWVDLNMNYAWSVAGPSAPSLTTTQPGSPVQLLAFDNGDILYAQAQMPHNLAVINDAFPVWYLEPHVHFSCNKAGQPDATHKNVTWRVDWELADINAAFTQSGTLQATMTVGANFTHYMLELGHLVFNPAPTLSAIFQCKLTRPASAQFEYDSGAASHTVLLEAFDLHIPVGNSSVVGTIFDSHN